MHHFSSIHVIETGLKEEKKKKKRGNFTLWEYVLPGKTDSLNTLDLFLPFNSAQEYYKSLMPLLIQLNADI